ncbi:MAG: nicotinate-nucleotide adenylyltransferase [Candidatus Acidiferrales bacterium]
MIASRGLRRQRIALFGGTFDPVHSGHIAVARAALRRFHLDRIYFIPCGRPPHKRGRELAPFPHRYAMVALACAGEDRLVASLAEAGKDLAGREVFYSADTVRRFLRKTREPSDHLYFMMGADSFLQIKTWHTPEILLGLCDFIVASRPGFASSTLRRAVPPSVLPPAREDLAPRGAGILSLRRSTVFLLDSVLSPVSATDVRNRVKHGRSIRGLVPASVEEYITRQGLYQR